MLTDVAITEWLPQHSTAAALDEELEGLAEVLHTSVNDGASIGFILPFSRDEALAFWRDRILPAVRAQKRRVLIARRRNRIVGTVQIDLDTPPNQRHRAEVMKVLVHPEARRLGIARALMTEIERVAQSAGRTLLTLDTSNDKAERLYSSMGFVLVGMIPRYALKAATPELEGTSIMYKELAGTP